MTAQLKTFPNFHVLKPHSVVEMKTQEHENQLSKQTGPTSQIKENVAFMSKSKLVEQQEETSSSTERLSVLHAKLHQEADRIRKWKVQTDIEIRQKEKQIHEATSTIDSLRKSILDLQLENEKLSLKLQDEMVNREDITMRINASRELCNILKCNTEKLEKNIAKCETEKTELKYLEKEHLHQFEELSSKFQNLELVANKHGTDISRQLEEERNGRREFETEMERRLAEAERSIKNFIELCDEKDIEIRDVRIIVQKNEEVIHSMEKTISKLQTAINEMEEDLILKDGELNATCSKLQEAKVLNDQKETRMAEILKELADAKTSLKNLQCELLSVKLDCDEHVRHSMKEKEEISSLLDSEQKRIEETNKRLLESLSTIESLKSSKDFLTMEITELTDQQCKSATEKEKLWAEYEILTKECSQLQERVKQLQDELRQEKETEKSQKEEMDILKNKIDYYIKGMSGTDELISSLRAALQTKEDEVLKLNDDYTEWKRQESVLLEELESTRQELGNTRSNLSDALSTSEEIKKTVADLERKCALWKAEKAVLHRENEELKRQLTIKETELLDARADVEILVEEKEALGNHISELEGEKASLIRENDEKNENLTGDMLIKEKEIAEMETKVKKLRSEITSKQKQMKDLEKEIKCLQSKVQSQEAELLAKGNELSQADQELESLRSAIAQNDALMLAVKVELNNARLKTEEINLQNDKSEKQVAEVMKNMDESKKACEERVAVMMGMLEKYKQENHKIIFQKDKEIETLRQDLSNALHAKQLCERKLNDADQESAAFQLKLKEEVQEKKQLKKEVGCLQENISVLQKEITTQETKVKELLNARVENLNVPKLDISIQATDSPEILLPPSPPRECPADVEEFVPVNWKLNQASTPKTPQLICLQSLESTVKKRRVGFSVGRDLNRSDSESPTLEVMDIEHISSVHNMPRSVKLGTPKAPAQVVVKGHSGGTPLSISRIPRGQAMVTSKPPPAPVEPKTPNIRKTPKTSAKFFHTSPRERLLSKKRTQKEEKTSWFDLDSVFGFGSED